MVQSKVIQGRVKAANRQLYDALAERYEEIDGRRSSALEAWLRRKLSVIRNRAPGGRLLDIGTGSGFVIRCATMLFTRRVGLDLSPRILAASSRTIDLAVAADVDHLPFADNSFDVITCFAVLHHLYDTEALVSEVARVLTPGGIFYSDHDMDATFSKRFRPLLLLYRELHGAKSKYSKASKEITPALYELAEWKENGVDSRDLVQRFESAGFSVETKFHWFGLVPILDKLLSKSLQARGWAPLLSVVAIGAKS